MITTKRFSVVDIKRKKNNSNIIAFSSYHYGVSQVIDQYADIILVGDSTGMVLYGHDTTNTVSLDTMICHTEAVVRATKKSLIVFDMVFSSYEISPEQAFANASRVIKETGCQAVKLEGNHSRTVKKLVDNGIPVLGHVGLLPQKANILGGYKRNKDAEKLLSEALSLQDAGAFAMVLECTTEEIAQLITKNVDIPVIGIGHDYLCDGQILVIDDLLGISEHIPRFIKKHLGVRKQMIDFVSDYVRTAKKQHQNRMEKDGSEPHIREDCS